VKRWLYRFWLITLAALVVQALCYWTLLPDRIASHFDLQGNPDSWSSTTSFMIMWLFAILVINIWPPTVGPLIRRLPPSMVSTPNRQFWLENEPRKALFIEITRAMLAGCIAGANIMLGLGLYYTYRVNVTGEGQISIWLGLAIETLITLFSLAWGLYRLMRPGRLDPIPS
jgi:hypothetical protein